MQAYHSLSSEESSPNALRGHEKKFDEFRFTEKISFFELCIHKIIS